MDDTTDWPFRSPGLGLILGGLAISWLSFALDPLLSGLGTLVLAGGWYLLNPDIGERRTIGAGIALVGGIGTVEASPFGLGLTPLLIGVAAIGLGMIDVVIGLVRRQRAKNG